MRLHGPVLLTYCANQSGLSAVRCSFSVALGDLVDKKLVDGLLKYTLSGL